MLAGWRVVFLAAGFLAAGFLVFGAVFFAEVLRAVFFAAAFLAVFRGAGGWVVTVGAALALAELPWFFAFGARWRLLDDALAGIPFAWRGDRTGASPGDRPLVPEEREHASRHARVTRKIRGIKRAGSGRLSTEQPSKGREGLHPVPRGVP